MTSLMHKLRDQVVFFWTYVQHPIWWIITLTAVSNTLSYVGQSEGFYDRICHDLYYHDPSVDCGDLASTPEADNHVAGTVAAWGTVFNLCVSAPAALACIFYGALSDAVGRKPVLILSFYADMVTYYGFVLIVAAYTVPVWFGVVVNTASGLLGFWPVYQEISIALLADANVRPNLLTIRLVALNLSYFAGGAVAGFLVGGLGDLLPSNTWIMVSACALELFQIYTCVFWLDKDIPPLYHLKKLVAEYRRMSSNNAAVMPAGEKRRLREEILESKAEVDDRYAKHLARSAGDPSFMVRTWRSFVRLQREAVKTYFTQRPNNGRAVIMLTTLAYFLIVVVDNLSGQVTAVFVIKAPLKWDAATFGYWNGFDSAISILICPIAMYLIYRYDIEDTYTIVAAASSRLVYNVIFSFSTVTWLPFLASALGALKRMDQFALQSFIAKQVPTGETGKLLAFVGLALNIGVLIGNVASGSIYYATVDWFPGTAFVVNAALVATAIAILVCVRVFLLRPARDHSTPSYLSEMPPEPRGSFLEITRF